MGALFVGFTSAMVSCKDYDDEKVGDLKGILADNEAKLRADLEAQKAALQKEIDALGAQITECKKTCGEFRTTVLNKFNEYLTLSSFNEFKDELGNRYYTKDEIKAMNFVTHEEFNQFVAGLSYYTQAQMDLKLQQLRDEMKKYVEKEAIAQTIADLLNQNNTVLTNALDEYFKNNAVIQEFLENAIDTDAVKALIAEEVAKINNVLSQVDATAKQALELAKANEIKINGLQTSVDNINNTLTTVQNDLLSLKNDLADLNGELNGVKGQVSILSDELIAVRNTADEAKAKAEANSALIQNLQNSYNELKNQVDELAQSTEAGFNELRALITENTEKIEELTEALAASLLLADEAHREMLETISGLAEKQDELAQNQADLAQKLDELKAEFDTKLAEVKTAVEAAAAQAEANRQALEKLAGFFQNTMAKFITGIEINGTYNPLFGEFALPFDVRSNVLVAFHGELNDRGLEFPTTRQVYYALPESKQWENITAEDIQMLGGSLENIPGYINMDGNQPIISCDGKEGNAGTLYLTVNPTDRDFTGTEFELINSRNEPCVVTLSDLKKSDHLIYFGYTRGASITGEQSSNGFYEAKATYKVEDLEKGHNRLRLELGELKDVAKDLRHFRDGVSLSNLFTAIYDNINKVLVADAVKATWTDDFGTKSVVSQYSVAATTIKPLSFAFAKDIEFDHIPGLYRVENLIDRLLKKVANAIPDAPIMNWTVTSIDDVEIGSDHARWTIHADNINFNYDGYCDLPSLTYYDQNGVPQTVQVGGTGKVHVTINKTSGTIVIEEDLYDLIAEVYGDVNDIVAKVNDLMNDIKDWVADVNDYLNDINNLTSYDGLKDKVHDALDRYIDAINKRFVKYFGHPNKFFQPLLVVRANDGYGRLSESETYPATVKGTHLYIKPTTYNAEILSPCYKKFVAVTNVSKDAVSAKGGDAACKNILDNINSQYNMKSVIDGNYIGYIEADFKAGYTYEILYSAADYFGKVVTKKFYVRVK